MTKPMWPASGQDAIHHQRLDLRYEPGETQARYGVARRMPDGSLEFYCEHSFTMSWEKDIAFVKMNPYPIHKLRPKGDYFIINFAKKTSPVILGKKVSKYNRTVSMKD